MSNSTVRNAEEEAFLRSIEEVISHTYRTLDLIKVHDLDAADLAPHLSIIVEEAWEENDIKNIEAFIKTTEQALDNFKGYYDSLKTDETTELELRRKIQTSDFRNYLKTILKITLENELITEAKKQKLLPQIDYTRSVELVQAFNVAARDLRSHLKKGYDPDRLKSEGEIRTIAQLYAQTFSAELPVDDDHKLIFRRILQDEATKAVTELNTASRDDAEINSICFNARNNALAALFSMSEQIGAIPTYIRKLGKDALGFKPPERSL